VKVIYLDNNATTQCAPEVIEAMAPYFGELYGNPSSMHSFGGQVAAKIQTARAQVAALIGADPEEIVFTSCGTESDSTALYAALATQPDRNHIVTTRVEHPAVLQPAQHLEKEGYRVTFLPVDRQGRLDLDQAAEAITDRTAIVSVMWANNETGTIFPVEEIAALAKAKGAVFHTDAVQAVGKIPINLQESRIDMLSLSGHKLHAPKGVGVLYLRKGTKFQPFLRGGHQERGRRGGTENVASIVGLGVAAELAGRRIDEENTRVATLRDRLERGLLTAIPAAYVNGDPERRLPNTTSISFEFVEGEAILLFLNETGICASSGSACTSGSLEPSHVLRAMGVPFTCAHGSIRLSLSVFTTEADVDTTLEVMPQVIAKLRAMSPYWADKVAS
jgi:cysteine desulfurase